MSSAEIKMSFLGLGLGTKVLKPGNRFILDRVVHEDGGKKTIRTSGGEVQHDGSVKQLDRKIEKTGFNLSETRVTIPGDIGPSIDGRRLLTRLPGLNRIFKYKP